MANRIKYTHFWSGDVGANNKDSACEYSAVEKHVGRMFPVICTTSAGAVDWISLIVVHPDADRNGCSIQ